MTGTPTPNFGLPQYDETDQAALDVLLNGITSQLDTSLKTAIDNGNNYRIGTDADRLAIASPTEGLKFRTTDTKLDWIYTGGAWVGDTGWTALTLTGGWVNFGAPFRSAAVRVKDDDIQFRGAIKGGLTGSANPVATLDVPFRPVGSDGQFMVPANVGFGDLRVQADGKLLIAAFYSGGNNGVVSLDQVRMAR